MPSCWPYVCGRAGDHKFTLIQRIQRARSHGQTILEYNGNLHFLQCQKRLMKRTFIICHPLLLLAVHYMVLVKVKGNINRKCIKKKNNNYIFF